LPGTSVLNRSQNSFTFCCGLFSFAWSLRLEGWRSTGMSAIVVLEIPGGLSTRAERTDIVCNEIQVSRKEECEGK
jgi:hypothetical protein